MKRLTAKEYRERANAAMTRSRESFDRCDTDGCVSQFANDLTARLNLTLADLADNNWEHEFPGLFHPDGSEVEGSKLVRCRDIYRGYGYVWKWVINHPNSETQWVTDGPRAIKKAGYVRGWRTAKAYATIQGNGTGFSGLTTCQVVIYEIKEDE